jgi:hypothetical protein
LPQRASTVKSPQERTTRAQTPGQQEDPRWP